MKRNKRRIAATFLTACFLLLPAALPPCSGGTEPAEMKVPAVSGLDDDAYKALADYLSTLAVIRAKYVDEKKTDWKYLFQASIRGLMHELDPFSNYESPDEFKSFHDGLSGQMVGIGIVISIRAQGLEIVSVTPGGPAEKAGLKSGDVILLIDGENAKSLSLPDAVRKIRGEKGSSVKISVYRPSRDAEMEFSAVRDVIPIRYVQGEKILPGTDGIAYCRILQFGETTARELDGTLAKLSKAGMTSLILDLRDNPGGLVGSVVPVCSRFLPAGQPVVSLEGRGKQELLKSDDVLPKYPDLPLVVLINANSASASEIFAACMKDYKRAVLIGEKSFGKGSVQVLIPFPPGNGALRITTAKYYTPGRHPIHGRGIVPDIVIPLSPALRNALSHQLNAHPGEVFPRMPNPVRDTALDRAVELLKGMRIFRNAHAAPAKNNPQATGENSSK